MLFRIFELEINPDNDVFLTTGRASKLKIWDLNSTDIFPEAVLQFKPNNTMAIANFDPTGLVLAVAYSESTNTT